MKLTERIKTLCQLGFFFKSYCNKNTEYKYEEFSKKLDLAISNSILSNPYFESENILYCINYWSEILEKNTLHSFISKFYLNKNISTVGIIMAGNIPLVGFHDFLCVFLTGNKSNIKLSRKDSSLFMFIIDFLKKQNHEFNNYVTIYENKLENYDAVIATGNDSSAKIFKKYFNNVPNIIRNSRHSVAVLNGNESNNDLKKLSLDIFMYYGLGCRSVSKLYIPKDYDINRIIKNLDDWKKIIDNSTYYNNYMYYKTIYLMKGDHFFDTGFSIIKESNLIGSPISTLFFEYYENTKELQKKLIVNQKKIQCIVSNNIVENSINFGSTQRPSIDDFSDKINTMEFLLKLS